MMRMIRTRLDELWNVLLFIYSRCLALISCVFTTVRRRLNTSTAQNRNDGAGWVHVKGDRRCLFAGEQGSEP